MDPLLDFLERRRGPGDNDYMRARLGERLGGRRADAAAGAGHQRYSAAERFGIFGGHGGPLPRCR